MVAVPMQLLVSVNCKLVWMVLFGPGVNLVSRNRMDPSVSGSSTVNCMLGSCELMWCSSCVLCSVLWITRVSFTNLSQRQGVWGSAKGFDFKLLHEQVGNEGLMGEPMASPWTC